MKSSWRLELILLALDEYDLNEVVESLKDFSLFLEKYCFAEPGGYFSIESAGYGSIEEVYLLVNFLSGGNVNLSELYRSGGTIIYDLNDLKSKIKITGSKYPATEELDNWYQDWINKSGRENSMDEYGQLIGVIGYVQRHRNRKHCLLIVQSGDV
jgi:hypothetical protein